MSWFLIAVLGCLILALVSISDKFILAKKIATPAVFVFYTTVPLVVLFAGLFFGIDVLTGNGLILAVVSGLCLMLGFWTMYKGFLASEVSHAGPLLGAAVPIFVLLISVGFLGEVLANKQLWACFLLIAGSLLISFEKSKLHTGWHKGLIWIVLSGALFAISHVAAKQLYDVYGFIPGLVWTRGLSGIFGLFLFLTPSVRAEVCSWFKTKECPPETVKVKNKIWLIFFNKVFGVVGVLLMQLATALGSVSVVNAMTGVQFGLLVIVVALMSKFFPQVFKEEYTKLEIAQEVIAVVIIGVGLGMLI